MSKPKTKSAVERLGGKMRGDIQPTSGYFGALALAAEIERRFRSPSGGGRATDPEWTEQRLVRLKTTTLKKLERVAQQLSSQGQRITSMQLAALLLEIVVKDTERSLDISGSAETHPTEEKD